MIRRNSTPLVKQLLQISDVVRRSVYAMREQHFSTTGGDRTGKAPDSNI
ncbi:hypothetical protein QN224_09140 [Sinorhizobium sp. 8-89]|nr:hypothetical protein [Sinorhizobium sp. 7-81]